mmetsp:Transcript_21044/g.58519  ORF Transcript_21044/g.58519 Transcript_21044/m.58519 type:complete len:548 (-) Transcript_21044:545-2188(-)|eukprot:CAMPEP_0172367274 /NCGR_PEP_ID=MMETSP1060-20121228/20151_1 /TAXON_ID=37318 /ORGANISM="Pseudo-nitzschia pungens, Strain cf. cingulata" /LENGTH=547 /DNA_ID=CAMNT_0013091461 /DNA_START=177 /DNA_END=1820 /DNA_ORIENTATION=+
MKLRGSTKISISVVDNVEDSKKVKEMPPVNTAWNARRALGDVSNQNSRPKESETDGENHTGADNRKQVLRRSRRLSSLAQAIGDHQESSVVGNEAAKAPAISQKNISTKEDHVDDIIHDSDASSSIANIDRNHEEAKSKMGPIKNRNPRRKMTFDEISSVESSLLEPRPKRKLAISKTIPNKKKKKKQSGGTKKELNKSEKTQDTQVSLLPDSAICLTSRNLRCPDLLVTSEDDHCLLRKMKGPFDASKFTTGIASYDKPNERKVDEVPIYVTDIFQRLFDAEEISKPLPSYMTDIQSKINSKMRALLIDWLVAVHKKFRLQPETLYLCVNIIDRYLSRVRIRREHLQLLGITALLVSSKYEEQYPPEVKDCVYITDRAYSAQQVLDMEFEIVMVLDFKMTVPTAYPFLQRFLHITKAPNVVRDLASYYTERMLQEYCVLNFRPSLLASAAVCVAWNNPRVREEMEQRESDGKLPRVLEIIINYTGFCEGEIRHTADVMCLKIQSDDNTVLYSPRMKKLSQVHSKYGTPRYNEVSRFPFPDVSHLLT